MMRCPRHWIRHLIDSGSAVCLGSAGGEGGGILRNGKTPGADPKHGGFALPNLTPPEAHTVLA